MIQVRSYSDFGVKFPTIQFNTIDHNSKSNCWIELKLYLKIPDVFFYVRVKFQVDRILGRCCDVGQNRLYDFFFIYFLLTCEFSIWQGSFFYKNVTIQFNAIDHNSKLNCWIELKLYLKISDVFCYVGVKFQVDRILERCYDVGQNRLYDFFLFTSF